ncbi:hypothetical protein Efla_003208 [Eimeria flavescens]
MEEAGEQSLAFRSNSEAVQQPAAAPNPLESAGQQETFAGLCGSLSRLLADLYCRKDLTCSPTQPEALAASEDAGAASGDLIQADANTQVSKQNEPIEADQPFCCTDTSEVEHALFGSACFSGAFSCILQGGICCVGPGKLEGSSVRFANGTEYKGLLCSHLELCGEASIRWPSGATYKGQVSLFFLNYLLGV